ANGTYSTAIGENTNAPARDEVVVGAYNTLYTPASPGTFVGTNRLFSIGNGISAASRSDAMVVLQNGNVGIGTSSPAAALNVQVNSNTRSA
ncbi:hypothetical protein ACI4B7_26765, partial [Klebsiella pneumoniae]|uniref:hypothetical protein n=1 Tax=Klebsiella pneumoniae TaxID=573 RepID=UPI00385192B6